MRKNTKSSMESSSQKENHPKFKWLRKTAVAALGLTLAACDNMPNNEIRLNPEDQSARFKVEYQYSEGSAGYNIVNYDIVVRKEGDTYMGLINQKSGWNKKHTSVESDNLDQVFDEISRALDSEQITDNTTHKKDKKVEFVKNEYKAKVLNAGDSDQTGEIKIKYKSE